MGLGFPPLALHSTVTRSPAAMLGDMLPPTSREREGGVVGPVLVVVLVVSISDAF